MSKRRAVTATLAFRLISLSVLRCGLGLYLLPLYPQVYAAWARGLLKAAGILCTALKRAACPML